jgi:hypothetical protein
VGRVGELGVVGGRPGADLVAFVNGEVVQYEAEPEVGGIAAASKLPWQAKWRWVVFSRLDWIESLAKNPGR